jgi:hypothetical protein
LDEKVTTREKKIWQPVKIWLISIYKLGFLFKIKPPARRAYAPEGHVKKNNHPVEIPGQAGI